MVDEATDVQIIAVTSVNDHAAQQVAAAQQQMAQQTALLAAQQAQLQALQQQLQQQLAPPTSNGDAPLLAVSIEPSSAGSNAMLEQMAALEQLVRTQAQQIQQMTLQASPQHSPQLSPQQSPRQTPQPAAVAQVSRFARKEPRAQDLREYDGASGAKLDEWLQELSLATFLYKLNTLEASTFGVSRLRGAALQWWLSLGSVQQQNLSEPDALAAALRARFQPVTAARMAREQLDRLQQGSRSVNDYIADFQRLRTQLPTMAEEDALYAFERGLRRELAEKLRVQGVSSVHEAIALAARVGGLLPSAPSGTTRAASAANQMEVDEGDGAQMEERITRAVLNAMHSQQSQGAAGVGAKTQTQRGHLNERGRGGGASRGGRGGNVSGSRFSSRGPPEVPGVPADVVQQRWDDKLCLRCGVAGHNSHACPNAISASRRLN